MFAPLLRSLPAPLCITFKYVFVAHACEYYVLLSCMQATAEAITLGECMHSEAISDVLTEVGGDFDAFSTCGGEATVMEAQPEVVEREVQAASIMMAKPAVARV